MRPSEFSAQLFSNHFVCRCFSSATTHHRTMNCANDAAIVSSANSNIQSRSNSSSGSNTNNNNNSHNVTSSASSSRRENTSAAMKAYIWPNGLSRVLAALSCSVGLFNISRFAIFSILFGGTVLNRIHFSI